MRSVSKIGLMFAIACCFQKQLCCYGVERPEYWQLVLRDGTATWESVQYLNPDGTPRFPVIGQPDHYGKIVMMAPFSESGAMVPYPAVVADKKMFFHSGIASRMFPDDWRNIVEAMFGTTPDERIESVKKIIQRLETDQHTEKTDALIRALFRVDRDMKLWQVEPASGEKTEINLNGGKTIPRQARYGLRGGDFTCKDDCLFDVMVVSHLLDICRDTDVNAYEGMLKQIPQGTLQKLQNSHVLQNCLYEKARPLPIPKVAIDQALRAACDNFYQKYIITNSQEPIEQYLNVIADKNEQFGSIHQALRPDLLSIAVSLGIPLGYDNLRSSDAIKAVLAEYRLGLLEKYFLVGVELGRVLRRSPFDMLRFEIWEDALLDIAIRHDSQPMLYQSAPIRSIVEELIQNGVKKVFVPRIVLEKAHNQEAVSDTSEVAWHMHGLNVQDGRGGWLRDAYHDVSHEIIKMVRDVGSELLDISLHDSQGGELQAASPFGFLGPGQAKSAVPNIIDKTLMELVKDRQLEADEVNWCLAKYAIRYMYENPMATVEDAVEAAAQFINIYLADEIHPNPGGSELDRRKADVRLYLLVTRARNLCHIGRWKEHLPFMSAISGQIKKMSEEQEDEKFQVVDREYFLPDLSRMDEKVKEQFSQRTPGLTLVTHVPLQRVVFKQVNVGVDDGKYTNCCGFFSTLWNSRQEAIRAAEVFEGIAENSPHSQGAFLSKLVSSHNQLDSNETLLFPVHNTFGLDTPQDHIEEAFRGDGVQGAEVTLLASMSLRKYRAVANPSEEFSHVPFVPLVTKGVEQSRRMREVSFWLDSMHYNALIEPGDYIGLAKLIRHRQNVPLIRRDVNRREVRDAILSEAFSLDDIENVLKNPVNQTLPIFVAAAIRRGDKEGLLASLNMRDLSEREIELIKKEAKLTTDPQIMAGIAAIEAKYKEFLKRLDDSVNLIDIVMQVKRSELLSSDQLVQYALASRVRIHNAIQTKNVARLLTILRNTQGNTQVYVPQVCIAAIEEDPILYSYPDIQMEIAHVKSARREMQEILQAKTASTEEILAQVNGNKQKEVFVHLLS
ncbi:MAG: hypothetical protein LBB34_02695 [Holosporales bacterium]|jgi:hypothetical protein|nr:hypothetical protein [Holosporales bacterium]